MLRRQIVIVSLELGHGGGKRVAQFWIHYVASERAVVEVAAGVLGTFTSEGRLGVELRLLAVLK